MSSFLVVRKTVELLQRIREGVPEAKRRVESVPVRGVFEGGGVGMRGCVCRDPVGKGMHGFVRASHETVLSHTSVHPQT